LVILSLAGSLLVLLPPVDRKIFLSLFLLFHFGGMATAVTAIDPPNSTGPWVSKQLWTYVYRPYLQFLYMTNAYHFYSPDPGPPNHLWFSVTYEDGSWEWVKYPNRKTSSVGMQYQRHLALPEHSFTPRPTLPYSAAQIEMLRRTQSDEEVERQAPGGSWEQIYKRRMDGSLQLAYAGKWEQNG